MPRRCCAWASDVTGLRLSLSDPVRRAAHRARGGGGARRQMSTSTTGRKHHANFFRSIEITKSHDVPDPALIVAVAAFNIVVDAWSWS